MKPHIHTCAHSSDFRLTFLCILMQVPSISFVLTCICLFLICTICLIQSLNILIILYFPICRSFIDDVGYEHSRVSELRDKLSSFLAGTSFTKSSSLTVQFSAIGALLSVLPLLFDKTVATQSRHLSGPFVVQARQISEWFVQLSNEHQSLARSFFS